MVCEFQAQAFSGSSKAENEITSTYEADELEDE